jgi:hypothetical protein
LSTCASRLSGSPGLFRWKNSETLRSENTGAAPRGTISRSRSMPDTASNGLVDGIGIERFAVTFRAERAHVEPL